jgi:predicted nuclease of predicted toxin-antitoxin system
MDSFLLTGQMTMEPPPTIHIIRTVNVTTEYISKNPLMVKKFDEEKHL